MMEYARLPGVRNKASLLLLGCATNDMMQGRDASFSVLDAAMDAGINALDTARVYGESEALLGRWMRARHNRDRLVLVSKGCHPLDISWENPAGISRLNAASLREDLEASFRLLDTDYIDVYLLHRDDPRQDLLPVLEVLHEYVIRGKIGAIGGSNWTHARIEEINALAQRNGLTPFSVSSPNFSLAVQAKDCWHGGVNISGPGNADARAWYAREGMPVIAYAGLGHGFFSGKVHSNAPHSQKCLDSFGQSGFCTPENLQRLARAEALSAEKRCTVPQLALAWLLHQPFLTLPVVGTSRPQGVIDSARALEIPLTDAECAWLNLESEER